MQPFDLPFDVAVLGKLSKSLEGKQYLSKGDLLSFFSQHFFQHVDEFVNKIISVWRRCALIVPSLNTPDVFALNFDQKLAPIDFNVLPLIFLNMVKA